METFLHNLSSHKSGGWIRQYYRAQRWITRFKELKYEESSDSNYYFDVMYTCFQNVYYIKDWLINDSATDLDNNSLNPFIDANLEIGICRDICNGTKHFIANSKYKVDDNFSIIREFDPLSKFNNKQMFDIVILAGGKKYSPTSLLEECMSKWDLFINKNITYKHGL